MPRRQYSSVDQDVPSSVASAFTVRNRGAAVGGRHGYGVRSWVRESIERGLREARKCVLVLTPHFLANDGWTNAEFNAIFTRELVDAHDVVLPIWHGVTNAQVFEYSPVLADRVGVPWSLGVDEVVRRLHRAVTA